MKKVLAVALVLCLLVPCAQAEKLAIDVYLFLSLYNIYADSIFGVPSLSQTAYYQDQDPYSSGKMTFWRDGFFIVNVIADGNGTITEADVYGKGDFDEGDFIARCANVLYCFDGIAVNNFEQLLSAYFRARVNANGTENSFALNTGSKILFLKSENVFIFSITK